MRVMWMIDDHHDEHERIESPTQWPPEGPRRVTSTGDKIDGLEE
jgi:hypothetical protein